MRETVDLLILGAGWTSDFLLPLLKTTSLTFAATSTTGRDETIPFRFDPDSSDHHQYESLPFARTILITFPLKGTGQSKHLVDAYLAAHRRLGDEPSWIQLGSTGIWNQQGWCDENSPYDRENARAVAEDELLQVYGKHATSFNLAGLYGGERKPRNWVSRVAKTEGDAKGKGALHLIHGDDVARAIVAACHAETFTKVGGRRWIVCDMRVYDWWWMMFEWDGEIEGKSLRACVARWMREEGVRALPREAGTLGRVMDGRAVWERLGIEPSRGAGDVLGR